MKFYKKIFVAVILLLAVLLMFTACQKKDGDDDSGYDEDYIEVTAIRVSMPTVYLSPDGAASSYQLRPTVIPENATNKKLYYYVSPKGLEYISVDEDGLITAKKITEEGQMIPLRIYSASNPDAYVIINVVVEIAEVKEIYFTQKEMSIYYYSDPVQLELIFEPYHAQDGRNVEYEVNDPTVVDVDPYGLLTPKKVGRTTVFARGRTLSGVTVEGNMTVIVKYAPGQGKYRIDTTTQLSKFNQVIGQPEEITFTLSILDPRCDPNPVIVWCVGGIPQNEMNGKYEFTYRPPLDATFGTYKISVRITPKFETVMELFAENTITLYEPFSGFNLLKKEPQGQKYEFNQLINLEPVMEEEYQAYDWYIKKQGDSGDGEYLGTSYYIDQEGSFSFVADKAGAFTVTVYGKNDDTIMDVKYISFNVIKYVEGDILQVTPQTNMQEKVPDSYDWYVASYDEENEIVGEHHFVGTTAGNNPFNYDTHIKGEGKYVLIAKPMIDGVGVFIDGEEVKEHTQPFAVWPKTGKTDIYYLTVDGAFIEGEYRPVIKWNAVGGANSFIVEVSRDRQVHIIDTTDAENEDLGIISRDYSVVLPLSIATLEQDFSVRVKQKGGIFSDKVDYTGKQISQRQYEFLEEIYMSINRYIIDMKELGDILNYLVTYKPAKYLLEKSDDGAETFLISIYTEMVYRRIDSSLYPVSDTEPFDDDYLNNIHNLVEGAINAYGIKQIKEVGFAYSDLYKSFDITVTIHKYDEYIHQEEEEDSSLNYEKNYTQTPRNEDFDDFTIESKNGVEVATSNQLYYVVAAGKKPLPAEGSVAEEIYNEAKAILREIIDSKMTSYQKVLAIHDYIASEISTDKKLREYSRLTPMPEDAYLYDGYHLEGALLRKKAVSLGKSKAFILLCGIEGIPALLIKGTKKGKEHYWNKALIGDNWYNIDTTDARCQRDGYSLINYAYFLKSDTKMHELGYISYGEHPPAEQDYDIKGAVQGCISITEIEDFDLQMSEYNNKINGLYSLGVYFEEGFESSVEFSDLILERLEEALNDDFIEFEELLQLTSNYFVLILYKP